MRTLIRTRPIFPLFLTLIFTVLACNMPLIGGPAAPHATVQPSAEALASFNEKWRALNLATPSGPFSVTFTEAELTSAVNAAIEQIEVEQNQPFSIHDVQVLLDSGAINVYGYARLEPLDVSGLVVALPGIGPDGLVDITISRVEFGRLVLGDSVLAGLTTSIERSINEPISASPFTIRLDAITISDHQIIISGTIMP